MNNNNDIQYKTLKFLKSLNNFLKSYILRVSNDLKNFKISLSGVGVEPTALDRGEPLEGF